MGAVPSPLPEIEIEAVGYGAGSRALEHGPNLLRAVVGTVPTANRDAERRAGRAGLKSRIESVVLLETTMDDQSPEVLAYVQERLLAGGALDVWSSPAFMKKGRLGSHLTVLCRPEDEANMVETIFRESTTLGVRRADHLRHVLEREWVSADVHGESVRVKVGRYGGEVVTLAPEFEDARQAALRQGVPLKEVMAEAAEQARRLLSI
jgi:hypothetical protein